MSKPLTAIALGGGITLAALGFVGAFLWVESPPEDELVEESPASARAGAAAAAMQKSMKPAADQPMPTKVDAGAYETRDSGLKVHDIVVGTGATPVDGQIVKVAYSGWLADGGKMFDSSVHNDRDPIEFQIGKAGVIEGWQKGIADMKVGGKRQIVIPPDLAYGERGRPPVIPPSATLIFDVELTGLGDVRVRPDRPDVDFASAKGVQKLDKGVKAIDLTVGTGPTVQERSVVDLEMTIWTPEGEVFFSSFDRPRAPSVLVGGARAERPPLDGLDIGVRGMKQGGIRYLHIPADQAFGERGQPPVVKPDSIIYAHLVAAEVSEPRTVPTKLVTFDRGAMTTTDSGLKYLDVVEGSGAQPKAGQVVFAEYSGWLEDGKLFDSSYKRKAAFSFPLGQGRVIPAWDEAISTMKVGGKRIIVAPADIAYGDKGQGDIPAGATLIFQIELVDVAEGPGGR